MPQHEPPADGEGEGTVRSVDPELRRASGYAHSLASLVVVAGIALAVAAVVVVINQLTQPGGNVTVTVPDPAELDVQHPDGLPDGAYLDVAGALDRVELEVARLPAPLRALSEATIVVTALLALTGAVLLRRVLLEIASGRPFAPVVSRRLRGLAVVVLAMALLPQAVDSLATVLVLQHLGWGAGSPIGYVIFEVDLLPLLLAAGLGIAAAVFRHGQRLTEDVAGLV